VRHLSAAAGVLHAAGVTGSLSPAHLLASYGVIGLALVLFAETGLLLGFFLPGDSLLFLAGAYAHSSAAGQPHPAILAVIAAAAVGAVLGGQTGYLIGRRAGPALFNRPDSRLFKQSYVERTHAYFERFGPRTLVLARFVPIVRTFAAPAAGVGRMSAPTFAVWNLLGGLLWALAVPLLGYALGGAINIDTYLVPITLVVVALSFIPVLLEVRRARRSSSL